MQKQKHKRASPWFVLSGLCLLLLIALGIAYAFMSQGTQAVVPYARGQPPAQPILITDAEGEVHEIPYVDWEHVEMTYPDVVGWVSVPQTSINYAVAQAPANDPTYYLTHDIFGNWNPLGIPYVDADCTGIEGFNTYIFGHNITFGPPMFAEFARFSDVDYADSHPFIYFQTPEQLMVLEVSAVDVVEGSDTTKRTDIESEKELSAWYERRFSESVVKRTNNPDTTRLITFVTCSYNYFSNERTLVYTQEIKIGTAYDHNLTTAQT